MVSYCSCAKFCFTDLYTFVYELEKHTFLFGFFLHDARAHGVMAFRKFWEYPCTPYLMTKTDRKFMQFMHEDASACDAFNCTLNAPKWPQLRRHGSIRNADIHHLPSQVRPTLFVFSFIHIASAVFITLYLFTFFRSCKRAPIPITDENVQKTFSITSELRPTIQVPVQKTMRFLPPAQNVLYHWEPDPVHGLRSI